MLDATNAGRSFAEPARFFWGGMYVGEAGGGDCADFIIFVRRLFFVCEEFVRCSGAAAAVAVAVVVVDGAVY